MSFIPNTNRPQYQSQRQRRRYQEQQMKKIEKKFGKHLPLPTEEDTMEYIKTKTNEQTDLSKILGV